MFDAHVDKSAKNARFEQLARMSLFFRENASLYLALTTLKTRF